MSGLWVYAALMMVCFSRFCVHKLFGLISVFDTQRFLPKCSLFHDKVQVHENSVCVHLIVRVGVSVCKGWGGRRDREGEGERVCVCVCKGGGGRRGRERGEGKEGRGRKSVCVCVYVCERE